METGPWHAGYSMGRLFPLQHRCSMGGHPYTARFLDASNDRRKNPAIFGKGKGDHGQISPQHFSTRKSQHFLCTRRTPLAFLSPIRTYPYLFIFVHLPSPFVVVQFIARLVFLVFAFSHLPSFHPPFSPLSTSYCLSFFQSSFLPS